MLVYTPRYTGVVTLQEAICTIKQLQHISGGADQYQLFTHLYYVCDSTNS